MRADRDSDWPTRLLEAIANTPAVDQRGLTAMELLALEYASRGLTPSMTAELRGVEVSTIKTQLKHARYKLRAKNVTHACCEALRRGLIS